MRVIIAGSRHIINMDVLQAAIDGAEQEGIYPTRIIQGGASGIDTLGLIWGVKRDIPVITFKADWEKYGRAAGPIRNKEMAANAEALIAVWNGETKNSGTYNMISEALAKKLLVFVLVWPGKEET